jgi:predicted kinase
MLLVAMMGLPGCGKTTLARQIAAALPAIILDKDTVRAALFPPTEIEYSTQQDDFCLNVMQQTAAYLLDKGRTVIIDGRPFSKRYQVDDLVDFCHKGLYPLKIIECVCSDENARQRLEADIADHRHLAGNRTFAMYLATKAKAEAIVIPHLVVNTDRPLDICLAVCLRYIREI